MFSLAAVVVFSTVVFFWQFCVQTVATAMNATGCVDTTPTCTRAHAHFPRAHLTRDDCTWLKGFAAQD